MVRWVEITELLNSEFANSSCPIETHGEAGPNGGINGWSRQSWRQMEARKAGV
jgi:hypothetical protein